MEKFKQFELNLKFFSGRLSADPEIKYFEKNASCKCTFAIPLKKSKEDKDPTWLNCFCWNKQAEKLAEEYKKGDEICVGGIFETNDYNGKQYINFHVKAVL